MKYTYALTELLHVIEIGVSEYLRSADQTLDVIRMTRKGSLHPSLLTSAQIEPISRGIQDHAPKAMFAVRGPEVRPEVMDIPFQFNSPSWETAQRSLL